MLVNRHVTESIDFHSIFFPTKEVIGNHQPFDYQYSLKYLLLCLTSLEQLEGLVMTTFLGELSL